MPSFNVAFWNLQNLFDTTLSPIAADFSYTPENGWTNDVKEAKIQNLARVINDMFSGAGPDILGLCEIENEGVVNELLGHLNRDDLVLAHIDSPDIRGIDCSLLYSKDLFDIIGNPIEHLVHLRYPTRDIFEVHLKVKANNAELIVLVNHWPSRSRGRRESEAFRVTVASHCGNIIDRHLKLDRQAYLTRPDSQATLDELNELWNKNIIIMGDLNDEPYDRSVLDELHAAKGFDRLEEEIKKGGGRNTPTPSSYFKKEATLFNCTWPLMSQPDRGTYYFGGSTNTMNMLDQIIISRGLYYGNSNLKMNRQLENGNELVSVDFGIFTPDYMLTSQATRRPKRFVFDKDEDTGVVSHNDGFSDHFPVFSSFQSV